MVASRAELTEEIKKNIAENKIMVYSGTYCPYCDRAKELLNKKGKAYKCIEIDKVPNGEEIFGALEIFSNQDTLPNIYIGGQHIGGNSDL